MLDYPLPELCTPPEVSAYARIPVGTLSQWRRT